MLASFNNARWRVHDTGLPNFGRWMVFEYPRALEQATCLVFGSSSTYSMFSYLCRVFSRLIFVHSAANIDPALIEAVAPGLSGLPVQWALSGAGALGKPVARQDHPRQAVVSDRGAGCPGQPEAHRGKR